MTNRRVLVTGGAGFIGSHLVDGLLDAGFSVGVIDNESTGSRGNVAADAEFVHGDVRDDDDLREAFDPIPMPSFISPDRRRYDSHMRTRRPILVSMSPAPSRYWSSASPSVCRVSSSPAR
jgi:NAD(P)-dependent dehydrogenase (short-subunit alcohol dehydrogenase family)